jgi:hypothetical protein
VKSLFWRTIVLSVILATPCTGSLAGSVSGPYLIWFNFAGDQDADNAIHDFTHAFDDDRLGHFEGTPLEGCWNPDALLLIRDYPPAITSTLVSAAVLHRSHTAGKRLRRLMLEGDDAIKGYDGIIVIVHSPKQTVMSFSASGRIKSRVAIDQSGHVDWPRAFCDVLPPISRKP